MNTPPPLPKPPQAKFSWKHYLGMILVSFLITAWTRGISRQNNNTSFSALQALQEATQDIQQEINEQYERIDTLWEMIEEMENR